jgi:hypothetical protein
VVGGEGATATRPSATRTSGRIPGQGIPGGSGGGGDDDDEDDDEEDAAHATG